jgi:hypothetical protein
MSSRTDGRRRQWVAIFLAGGLLISIAGCGRTVIESEESRKAIDALYTAVTSKRLDLVDSCEDRFRELETAGAIPSATAKQLADIIARARQQQWQPAAERLDKLIRRIAP